MQHHEEHNPEEQTQSSSTRIWHLPPIILYHIGYGSSEIQVSKMERRQKLFHVLSTSFFSITANLLGNQGLDYELLSGVKTARVGNMLNAEQVQWKTYISTEFWNRKFIILYFQNFWGTSNINLIRGDSIFWYLASNVSICFGVFH